MTTETSTIGSASPAQPTTPSTIHGQCKSTHTPPLLLQPSMARSESLLLQPSKTRFELREREREELKRENLFSFSVRAERERERES
jgi:hypothetical protein